jgi:hypothetical protein
VVRASGFFAACLLLVSSLAHFKPDNGAAIFLQKLGGFTTLYGVTIRKFVLMVAAVRISVTKYFIIYN